jgi:hypothetical protein
VTGAATEVLFDGGARSAALQAARAAYEAAVARYRQTVLTTFREVEDALSGVRILALQQVAQQAAVASATRAVEIALNEYRAGTQNYTTVVTAQAIELSNRVAALQIQASRFTTAVALIRALGVAGMGAVCPRKASSWRLAYRSTKDRPCTRTSDVCWVVYCMSNRSQRRRCCAPLLRCRIVTTPSFTRRFDG